MGQLSGARLIEEVDTCGIGGVAISDEGERLVLGGSANGFLHSRSSREGISGVGQVVGSDLTSGGREEEEDIVVFAADLEVGLVPGLGGVSLPFVGEVELMAEGGGSLRVVEDRLIRGREREDGFEDEGGFSGGEA